MIWAYGQTSEFYKEDQLKYHGRGNRWGFRKCLSFFFFGKYLILLTMVNTRKNTLVLSASPNYMVFHYTTGENRFTTLTQGGRLPRPGRSVNIPSFALCYVGELIWSILLETGKTI